MSKNTRPSLSAAARAAGQKPTGLALKAAFGTLYVPIEVETAGSSAIESWILGLDLTAHQLAQLGIGAPVAEAPEVAPPVVVPAPDHSTHVTLSE